MSRNYVFLNAEGYMDIMTKVEAQAIERSGACSLWEYISTPTTWPQQNVPVVPLMEARPGATEPVNGPVTMWEIQNGPAEVVPGRHALDWTYDELCQLMHLFPFSQCDAAEFASKVQRTDLSVRMRMTKLHSLINEQRIRWDGTRILRGKRAAVYQWPLGFQNPK